MHNSRDLKHFVDMTMGREQADLLFVNARVVDVFTGVIHECPVSVGAGRILGFSELPARQVVDAGGRWLLPGLIDAHIHIESSMLTPTRFAELVLPHGTTTVIADPHEIANVHGMEGIRYMLEKGRGLPLNIMVSLPSCVPATPFEDSGADLDAYALESFIHDPKVSGIGEMMNFPGVLEGDEEVLAKIILGRNYDKVVDGHAPGLLGRGLDAYIAAGIGNTHECTTLREMRENLCRGAYVFIREGSAAKNLADLLPGVTPAAARRCAFCSDDRHAEDIQKEGHMDHCLRRAVSLGLDPVAAVTMCTLNPAECFGLRYKGAIAPGRDADLVLVDDLKEFRVRRVYVAGRLVAEDGSAILPLRDVPVRIRPGESVRIAPLVDDAFVIRPSGPKVRVIGVNPHSLLTRHELRDVRLDNDGIFHCADNPGLCKMAVIERHRATGNIGLGLLEGYGLAGGAIASTIAHDSHNIVVAGDNDPDMLLAVSELVSIGGGIVMVSHGGVIGRLPLPIAGLVSAAPVSETSATVEAMLRKAHDDLAIPRDIEPFMTLSFMALPVIPSLKLTTRGLFDVDAFHFVTLDSTSSQSTRTEKI